MFDPDVRPSPIRPSDRPGRGHPVDRLPVGPGPTEQPTDADGERLDRLHRRLMGYYRREIDRQAGNRAEQAEDEDFYDNDQWDPQDAALLRERGQVPLTYNVVASTVNWVLGSQKRARADFRVLPREKEDAKPAERKSKLLKYLAQVNREGHAVSRAFGDAVRAGVGWLECGAQDTDDGEPVYIRTESWRNILWDSASVEDDLADARYLFRSKWVDEDIALALFPDRRDLVRRAADTPAGAGWDSLEGDAAMDTHERTVADPVAPGSDWDQDRRRVRLIECWFRQPTTVAKIRGGRFGGDAFEDTAAQREEIAAGKAVVVEKTALAMFVAIMTPLDILYLERSPYRHDKFPFTPIWAYRRGRDHMPYGMIRTLKDMQRDVNKRAAKALHILSTNKTIMDKNAVPDLAAFAEEAARPDAILVKEPGSHLEIGADRDLGPAHLDLMSRSIAMIQSSSGVTDENMGRETNASSGRAITARQSQGALATAGLFDNLFFARQCHGEKLLSLVEQFFTEAKAIRITNMRGTPEYVTVNDGLPENDIVRNKADFIIAEQEWRDSLRQAQTQELLELLQQLAPAAPQLAMVMLDLIVEIMDIPNREELVERIRAVTGMRDPDAEEPTPQERARAEKEARMEALQQAGVEAELREKQAKAAKADAEARRILAQNAGENVDTLRAALETALEIIAAPSAVPVADTVLDEAGFRPAPPTASPSARPGDRP